MLLSVMGSGHELQIDGIGGGNPLTSKVAIVGPATVPGADVDYLFAQVDVDRLIVDTAPELRQHALRRGPVRPRGRARRRRGPGEPGRIHNLNTGKLIEAVVQTPSARSPTTAAAIDGVPGAAAPIRLTFVDAEGSRPASSCRRGSPRDQIDGIETSCIDMAMPHADRRGSVRQDRRRAPGRAGPGQRFLGRLEAMRLAAGRLMGLGDVGQRVVPKPVLLARPSAGGTLHARYFMPHDCHKALAITGAVCIARACRLKGSVASELARLPEPDGLGRQTVVIEHPAGRIEVELAEDPASRTIRRVSLLRTARRLFEGHVLVRHADLAAARAPA